MKNNLFNRNLLRVSLLMLSVLLLLTNSCKKDSKKLSDIELVQNAKEWFRAQPSVFYNPNWDKVTVIHSEDLNFVVLPSNISLCNEDAIIYSYLVINISKNETEGNLIELFDVEGVGTENLKHDIISKYLIGGGKINIPGNVSLKVLLFDVNHKFIKGNAFVNGEYSGQLNLIAPKDLKSQLLMKEVGSTKKETCVDYYWVLSDTKSDIIYSATYLYSICSGGGNGGGSGSGGGGGSTSTKKEIINNITDQCLKTTINEALASNKDVKGFLSEVINKFSGRDNGIKILLYNGDIVNPAKTDPSFGADGKFTAAITFQNGFYDDVSKEAVVAALIHEVVHAYLLQTNNAYRTLPMEEQHNYLFTNFVKDIAGYLKSKYNMDKADAWGLAWSGIGDVINKANDDTAFPTEPGETMTKSELATSMAPYKHIDKNAGAKGTPNCPNK